MRMHSSFVAGCLAIVRAPGLTSLYWVSRVPCFPKTGSVTPIGAASSERPDKTEARRASVC